MRCLNVDGLVRTDRRVIIDYLGTRSGEVFTAEALARAARRLEDLSFVSSTAPALRPRAGRHLDDHADCQGAVDAPEGPWMG